MELHEYPRPTNDTGIGVHWTVGFASAIGIGKIRDFWIPELKALGVKWVKIFNHDGAIDFAELLLAEGMMPIVRIFRPSPNPSTLDVREVVHLDSFIRAGVRYFEFNSEPDRDSEWKGGRVPANGFELVVDNTIDNLETILERGGMPGIPAVANGSRWDIVGRIVAKGRKDLFNGPVWQATHNYARNRPLDYPYDSGNQEGAPFSQRFYEAVQNSDWGEDPWRGRELADVNRLRLDRCNPGATIMDDNACWLAYEYFDARNRKHLGHSIPILATECGYLVGEDIDPRYPATTPELHMAQTLEACRVMMGSSERFQIAPDYYFCSAFWLLGNGVLGSSSNWWEHHAWYSDKWPDGMLPIVRTLKAEPKKIRQWQGQGTANPEIGAYGVLRGTVSHAGEHRTLILEQNGQEVARTALDANSRYVIGDLPAGNYLLRVEGTTVEQPVSLPPDQKVVQVNLNLAQSGSDSGGSSIEGTVRGGAGAVVLLLRTSDGEDWVTMVKDDGTFRFVELGAGTYTLRVQSDGNTDLTTEQPLHAPDVDITLDGENRQQVELAVPGWGYTIRRRESGNRHGALQCAVPGYNGLQVQAVLNDWRSEPVLTGSAPHLGQSACEITPLEPGHYTLSITRTDDPHDSRGGPPIQLQAFVQVDKKTVPFVEFVYTQPTDEQPARVTESAIRGRIIGGCEPGRRLTVWLIDQQANRREQQIGDDCTFAFEHLAPGLYAVEVAGYADMARRADIALDGRNTVQLELLVPEEETPHTHEPETLEDDSVILGRVPQGAGHRARLVDSVGNERQQIVESDNTFRFDGLAAGVYTLLVEGGYEQGDLTLDGANGIEVNFQPLELNWEYQTSPAGSMPGYSVIRVEVEGMRGLPIYIWKEDWEGMMRRTGSKPEYGECSAEFSPLGPGIYMVEPEGLDVYADIELTGLEVVWVDFRRRAVPISPHEVRPFAQGSRARNGNADSTLERQDDLHTGSEPRRHAFPAFDGEASDYTDSTTAQEGEPDIDSFTSLRFDNLPQDAPDSRAVDSGLLETDTPESDASGGESSPFPVGEHEPWHSDQEIWGRRAEEHDYTGEHHNREDDSREDGGGENDVGAPGAVSSTNDWHRTEQLPEHSQETHAPSTPPQASRPENQRTRQYVYLVEQVNVLEDQISLLRYAAQNQPDIGQALEEALRADLVLIVAPGLDVTGPQSVARQTPSSASESQTDHAANATTVNMWAAPEHSEADEPVPGAIAPEEPVSTTDAQEPPTADDIAQKADAELENFDWDLDEHTNLDADWPDWPARDRPESPAEDTPAGATATGDPLSDISFHTDSDWRDLQTGSGSGGDHADEDVTGDYGARNSISAWGFQYDSDEGGSFDDAHMAWGSDAGQAEDRETSETETGIEGNAATTPELENTQAAQQESGDDSEPESPLQNDSQQDDTQHGDPQNSEAQPVGTQATQAIDDLYAAWIAAASRTRNSSTAATPETGDSASESAPDETSAVEMSEPDTAGPDTTGSDTTGPETTGIDLPDIHVPEANAPDAPEAETAHAGDIGEDDQNAEVTTEEAEEAEESEAAVATRDPLLARQRALLAEVENIEAQLRAAGVRFRRITGPLSAQLPLP